MTGWRCRSCWCAEVAEFVHPRLGPVEVVRSPRARRITLSVRASGTVRLSHPWHTARARALEFLDSRVEWVMAARERMARRQAALPRMSPEEERARIEELRRAAKADLPARTERIAAQLGLRYGRLTIRAARTKWGSCTSRNDLSLSLFLMTLPEHLRDYVIVHELCHTVHHDHSPQFHALVDRCVGGREKAPARELRGYTIRG